MRILYRFWAIFIIAGKRILSQPWMALATTLGMIFAISLSMSVPLYASSVYNQIFLHQVGGVAEEGEASSGKSHPPFSFLFTYDSNILGNLEWKDIEKVDQFLQQQTGPILELPILTSVRYFSTDPMALFPSSVEQFSNDQKPLIWSSFSFLSDLEDHINVIEGEFPKPSSDTSGTIDVMITEQLAMTLGFQVGEEYTLFARNQVINGVRSTISIPVRIAGVFQAKDPTENYWFIRPELLKERLIVPEETFAQAVSGRLNNEVYSAFWYQLADGSRVRPEQAMSLVARIISLQRQAEQQLPKIRLAISPVDSLYSYQRSANLLTVLLFAFSVPIFGLLLAFITMTSGMTVERQRNEIAVLRSRGAMTAQMIGIAVVESILLGAVALVVSLPISSAVALAIGRTRSFLDFSATANFHLNWTPTTFYFGLGAILLTMLARLLPTFRAARDNVIQYKRERSRSLKAPFWQRMWLDVLLLIPAGYGIYLLRQQGSIDALDASTRGDPFSNPLLIMVPALALFALSLLFMRVMPLLMSAITWVASRTRSVGLMMAARHLARTPSTYTLPLVLLILTLSLSAFTATLAGTLDNHLHDQIFYQIGSDVSFLDLGDSPTEMSAGASPAPAASDNEFLGQSQSGETAPGWFFLPVSDYLQLSGAEDVTRVGRYQATALLGSSTKTGIVLGVDRYNFPNISFWRPDFAEASLGELMNRLAATPDGLLVPEEFQAEHLLNPGDIVTLRIVNSQTSREVDFHYVGTFKLFPTYYPGKEPLFVGNLDYIFMSMGGEYPYQVWMKAAGPVDIDQMSRDATLAIGARTMSWKESASLITAEQSRPERQGLFGVLSVGFTAAALLTVLGFLLYALLSYQRRFVELGVLRAVGLSAGQMTIFLASELAFLILMGGLIGTVLGVWISNLFIPYLQIGADPASQIPPYVVYIAWPAIMRVYALFGLLFIVALATLMLLLRRMRIFQAIKMGETV